MDRNKIIKMLLILAGILVIVRGLTQFLNRNAMSLSDYAKQNTASLQDLNKGGRRLPSSPE